jgi:hypothetical protein
MACISTAQAVVTTTLFPSGWPGLPADGPDTERVEQAGPQVLGQRHPALRWMMLASVYVQGWL